MSFPVGSLSSANRWRRVSSPRIPSQKVSRHDVFFFVFSCFGVVRIHFRAASSNSVCQQWTSLCTQRQKQKYAHHPLIRSAYRFLHCVSRSAHLENMTRYGGGGAIYPGTNTHYFCTVGERKSFVRVCLLPSPPQVSTAIYIGTRDIF